MYLPNTNVGRPVHVVAAHSTVSGGIHGLDRVGPRFVAIVAQVLRQMAQ